MKDDLKLVSSSKKNETIMKRKRDRSWRSWNDSIRKDMQNRRFEGKRRQIAL